VSEYEAFLRSKVAVAPTAGIEVDPAALHPSLFPFQRAVVAWALARGRAALFLECGLGKTIQQLVWADEVCRRTGGRVLILAPLAVGRQTADEAAHFGVAAVVARSQAEADAGPAITITNYEMLEHVDPARYVGVVLDESSCLKAYMGATKRRLVEAFAMTPYRLCCTATPAPNDHMELGNHAAFLGVMSSAEMLTRWFINDTMQAGNYRLKRHAERAYWDWVASWAVSGRRPSDLGFSDDGYNLPPLQMHQLTVETDLMTDRGDHLFRLPDLNATGIHHEARLTAPARCATVAALVNASNEAWAVWCNTNDEADRLTAAIPGAVEVRGSESVGEKERKLAMFISGEARVLITKPTIAGWGLNFQRCSHTAFVGLTYSFEEVYQALRRFYRFGQTRSVEAYIVAAETEGQVVATFERKRLAHERMVDQMSHAAHPLTRTRDLSLTDYEPRTPMDRPAWLISHDQEVTALS